MWDWQHKDGVSWIKIERERQRENMCVCVCVWRLWLMSFVQDKIFGMKIEAHIILLQNAPN